MNRQRILILAFAAVMQAGFLTCFCDQATSAEVPARTAANPVISVDGFNLVFLFVANAGVLLVAGTFWFALFKGSDVLGINWAPVWKPSRVKLSHQQYEQEMQQSTNGEYAPESNTDSNEYGA